MTTLSDEIKAVDGRINAYKNQIQVTRTNLTNTEFVERSIKKLEDSIAVMQKQVEALRASIENGPAIIDECKAQIQHLVKKRKLLLHKRDIDKMIELQAQLNRLQEAHGEAVIKEAMEEVLQHEE